ncbi:uncharacterized protein LOC109538449 [Dendroctonus ponderosae]|uniref:uncharacterized protein LOC109538449 n=1 Tax=Dendroctonus ponderosae TaxID=77166 RepID=UPI0020359468|nr:uncharacterized protein LOC109538449 [Dendroctonus ponderosae]
MSSRSHSVKSVFDPQSFLDDIDDLDYEPDGVEKPLEEVPAPDQNGRDLILESYHNSETQNFNFQPLVFPKSASSIQSFRDFDYKHLDVDIDQNSFRTHYNSYVSNSERSYHLDSSDDEESTVPFSNSSFQVSDLYYSYDATTKSDHYNNMENYPDETAASAKSISHTSSNSVGRDDNLTMSRVEENFSLLSNKPDIPVSKPTPLNFTIQVTGERRRFLNKLTLKTIQNPWLDTIKSYLEDIILLKSTDNVIKFCPVEETEIGFPMFSSRSSKTSDVSSSSFSVFKVPLKRPPTRQKGIMQSSPACSITVNDPTAREDNFDIISLIASTNMEDDPVHETIFDNDVKSEASSVPSLPQQMPEAVNEDINKMNFVAAWLQTSSIPRVPQVYMGLCFNFFFNNNCHKVFCSNKHNLKCKINQLLSLPEDLFYVAYNYAKSNPIFFSKIFKEFASMFAIKGNKEELINMLDLFLNSNHPMLDRIVGVTTVIHSLKFTDLNTFENAVEYIMCRVDRSKCVNLDSALLETIISANDFPSHWSLIRKLIERGEKIPKKMAQRFVAHLMKPPVNNGMCKEVYEYIKKYQCIDLPTVHFSIREPFLKLCTRESSEEHQDDVSATTTNTAFKSSQENIIANGNRIGAESSNGLACVFQPIPSQESETFEGEQENMAKSVQSANFIPPEDIDFSDLNEKNRRSSPTGFREIHQSPSSTGTAANHPVQDQPQSFILNSQRYRVDRKRKNSGSSSEGNSKEQIGTKQLNPGYPLATTYNKEGLQYDPTNDYRPRPPKIKVTQDLSRKGTPTFPTIGAYVDQPVEITVGQNHISGLQKNVSNIGSIETTDASHALEAEANADDSFVPLRPEPNSLTGDTNSKFGSARVQEANCFAENLVSISVDTHYGSSKITDHPRFGHLYFQPSYNINVSLHNFYLAEIDNIDIDEDDVLALNDCVKTGDGERFLALCCKYQGPSTIQNFISMTLAHLKGMNQMIARKYQSLLTSIENTKPDFYKCVFFRVILEVITMNILFILEARNMFVDVQYLLAKFSDWDSLVTSRLFITNTNASMSIMGRYLFLAKLLVHCKPELAYEILDCPTFKFLDENYTWPYHPANPIPEIFNSDLHARNLVIEQLLKTGYRLNIVCVIQLYKKALKRKGGIWLFDVKPFIEPMVTSVINNGKPGQLKQIFAEIDMFCNHLQKLTLRAFLISIYSFLKKTDCFKLFEICVARDVYNQITNGDALEHLIEIKTIMLPCEIELIILYYFYQLREIRNLPPGSEPLTFNITLPGTNLNCKYLPVLNVNRSVKQIVENIKSVVQSKCSIEAKQVNSNVVVIEKNDLIQFLENAQGCGM